MDAKKEKLIRQLLGQVNIADEDYHGEQYWDLFHRRQQLTLKMLAVLLEEALEKK